MGYEPIRFLSGQHVTFERMDHNASGSERGAGRSPASTPCSPGEGTRLELTPRFDEPGELALHDGERRWEYVRAFRTHPLSDPERFIVLRACPAGETGEVEVGVLRDMRELAPADRKLLEDALARRYLVQTIQRIESIREEFGYMYWDVETDRGARALVLPRWNQSHVVEMGEDGQGRIVIDVWGNRSLILDLEALDDRSQRLFELFVHW